MLRASREQKAARAGIAVHVLLMLTIVLVYLVYSASQFNEIADANALDYAQIARHVYRGEGFTTSFIKPISLVYNQSIENHPDLTYAPLHILWTSVIMHALGPNDRAVSHASGFVFLLSVPIVYLLAWRIFDRRAAMLAAVLYGLNVPFLAYAVSGLEVAMLALWVTVMLLMLYQVGHDDQRREWLWVISAGVALGLLYLTKYVWALAAIPTVFYLWKVHPERRLARPLVYLGLALLVSVPWLVRNFNLTGDPFFTLRSIDALESTKEYPGNSLHRTFSRNLPTFINFAFNNPRAIVDKLRDGLMLYYGTITALGGPYVTALFLVAIIVTMGDTNFERWRYMIYAYIGIMALGLSLLIATPRLIMPIGPAVIVIGAGYFWRLLDTRLQPVAVLLRGRAIALAVGVLLVLHVIPLLTTVTPASTLLRQSEDPVESAAVQLNDVTQGPIVTDIPWLIAWKADRDAVWLPQTVVDLRNCEQAVGPFQWILLSPMLPRMANQEHLQRWAEVWARGLRADTEFEGFEVDARLSTGRWILLKRKPVSEQTH